MTLREFKSLTKQKQYRIIRYTGVYLASRSLGNLKAELFQVSGFYLEAFYRMPGEEMSFMKVFDSTASLDPYLQAIDLQSLLPHTRS
jgi:hypothetical protein